MRLVYMSPGPAAARGDEVSLPYRTRTGLAEMAKSWPGDIVLIAPPLAGQPAAEAEWLRKNELPFNVEIDSEPEVALARIHPTVVNGLHRAEGRRWKDAADHVVLTTENDLRLRIAQANIGASPLQRVRSTLGLIRREPALRAIAKDVDGLQCNGPLAFESYGRLSANAMHFHDHRIHAADIEAAQRQSPRTGGPLRLAFSGRMTAIKGPQHVVEMARLLHDVGADVQVTFFGTGGMEDQLRRAAPSNVEFAGFVPFDPDWKRRMREEIDVLVAPHPQGDPSCTYFEALGCGVPVLGFPNATWRRVVDAHPVGWVSKEMSGASLADKVLELIGDPEQLTRARVAATEFMTSRSFETTTRRRVEHMLSVV